MKRSEYLWHYADRAHRRQPVTYDLRGSNGPSDTCLKVPFRFDPLWTKDSLHGVVVLGGSPAAREKVGLAYGMQPEDIVLIAGGGSLANHHVLHVLADHQDTILVERPGYEALHASAKATGAKVVDLPRTPQNGFQVDLQQLKALLEEHHPRVVLLTNLHNPSSFAVRNLSEIVQLIEAFNNSSSSSNESGHHEQKRRTILMIDEIYREMAVSGDIPCAATLGRDVVCTTSTTKTYGLSGIRMGAVLSCNKDIVEGVIAYNTVAAVANSAVLENLWLQFFEHRDTVLHDIRQLREERYAIVKQILSDGGVQFFAPDGGNTLIAELPRNDKGQLIDDNEFVKRLIREHDTGVTQGTFFGLPGHIRIGFMDVPDTNTLKEGLRRFVQLHNDHSDSVII
ncbi:hypothetical protein QOT17_003429 [Balamuthia mandrillaris]